MDNAIGLASEKTTPKVENGLPEIGARLDRLASSKVVWKIMVLLALGGLFDAYMISTGGNIAPGLYKSHLLTAASKSFFDPHSYAAFNAATFVGLLVASLGCGFIADRFGRRTIFTIGLLWFSLCALAMAFQNSGLGLIGWRFMLAIGTGLEVITIDAYLSELMPKRTRGRAFAVSNSIHSCGQPLAALAAFSLVPYHLLGVDGWRWVVVLGSVGAVAIQGGIAIGTARRGVILTNRVGDSSRMIARRGGLRDDGRCARQPARHPRRRPPLLSRNGRTEGRSLNPV